MRFEGESRDLTLTADGAGALTGDRREVKMKGAGGGQRGAGQQTCCIQLVFIKRGLCPKHLSCATLIFPTAL